VDPKPSETAEAIKAHGLDPFAQPVNKKSSHLMRDKFIVGRPELRLDRFRKLHQRWFAASNNNFITYNFSENAEANDENMLVIESTALAKAYDKYCNKLFTLYQKTGPKKP
jgi:hypothetical protein